MKVDRPAGADFTSVDPGPFTLPAEPPPLPPQVGFKGTVGSGKTQDMIGLAKELLAADPNAAVFFFVPDHSLAPEAAERFRAELPGKSVGVLRGLSQPDPNAPPDAPRTMCQRAGDAKAVGEAGGDVADLCGSKRRGFCRFHPDAGGTCGYIAQSRARNQVWLLMHAMLSRPAPPALRRPGAPAADLAFIDESFDKAMLNESTLDLADLAWAGWAAVPDHQGDLVPGFASKRLTGVLAALLGVLAGATPGVGIDSAALAAAGLTGAQCREARTYALRCKVALPAALPGTAPGAAAGALGAAAGNQRVMRMAKLLEIAADLLDGRTAPAALQVKDKAGARRVMLRWRSDIHSDWLDAPGGIIYADATMQEDIARQYLPRLSVLPWLPTEAPHMRVVQVEDSVFGYSAVLEGANPGPEGKKAAARNTRRVWRVANELAVRFKGMGAPGGPDVLLVVPKKLERDLIRMGLPANVGTLHFGKLRGQDAFKGVRAMLVVSRPELPPQAAEDTAEIIFGRPVAWLPAGKYYPNHKTVRVMVGGKGRIVERAAYHPDPNAEAVRRACCEDELTQAIGRVRGSHRTAANPVDVYMLTNVPLVDVPVSQVCTLDDIWRAFAGEDPVAEMLKAGVLPDNFPGVGTVLSGRGFFKGAAYPGKAAEKRFSRDPSERAALDAARRGVLHAKGGQTSYCISTGGLSPLHVPSPWASYIYRCQGSGPKSWIVLVSPAHPDPRAAVEALLGPLARFEVAGAAPAKKAPRPARAAQRPACPAPASAAAAPGPALPPPPPVPAQEDAAMPSPAPPMAPSPATQDQQAELDARLAATPVGLPAVLDDLTRWGCLTLAGRRQHMNRFRTERGSHAVRERRVLARLVQEVGREALAAAAMSAARAKLGLSPRGAPA